MSGNAQPDDRPAVGGSDSMVHFFSICGPKFAEFSTLVQMRSSPKSEIADIFMPQPGHIT